MFGCDGKIGLLSSSLPQEILGSLQTEEDLIQHLQSSDKPDEISNDKPNELSSDKPNEHDEDIAIKVRENMSDTITCHLCSNEEVIRNERKLASDSMTKQAVRMRNLSEKILTEVDVGANVLVAIPHVDFMAVVTGKNMVINWELKMEYYVDFTPVISLNCLTVTLLLLNL
ncbi:unnamed protein product [Mytilus edulis]|uniref:Uncharacterized protein n=1 Tax=Mytilus edulis TaxID=6550 RepID=A0A8S3R7V2_MYTED|nr:unnamed protein product [Mytilus edulis]